MSSQIPPNPYFSGINYNSSFFSTVATYLTEAIANSKYLKIIGGTLNGFLGILRTARVELDVNGKAVINNGTSGPPDIGQFGGPGTKLILTEAITGQSPIALGTENNNLWLGTSSAGSHKFYTGLTQRMFIDNNGAVGIGTATPTSANTKLTIRGSSSGYPEPLVDIVQTAGWNGNYALQVTGYTNLGGFRINADDGGNSIYQTLPNKDMGMAQNPTAGNTGNISILTHGVGHIKFYTNGSNERARIDEGGSFYVNTYGYFGALDNSGLRIDKTGLFLSSANVAPLNIYHQNTGQSIKLGFFGGNNIILTINNTYAEFSQPALATKVGIGTASIPTNILQVGDGARLRISNDSTDYSLIGTKNVDDTNNTRIVISGYQRAGFSGRIEHYATSGGGHLFNNDGNRVIEFFNTGINILKSITTYGANYYSSGTSISYGSKVKSGSLITYFGFFIDASSFANCMVHFSASHPAPNYTCWHGRIIYNNGGIVASISNYYGLTMTVEEFIENGTNAKYIIVYPTISYTTSTSLRINFYS